MRSEEACASQRTPANSGAGLRAEYQLDRSCSAMPSSSQTCPSQKRREP